jgi:toluene monooxygenase system protein E
MAADVSGNSEVIRNWIAKWEPLADRAIDAFCAALPDVPDAADAAKEATRAFRRSLPGL